MTAPAPYTTWRKHWPQCSHGRRYTYGVLRVERGVVHWRRSDGLHGQTPVSEWDAYTLAEKPGPGWREVKGLPPSRNALGPALRKVSPDERGGAPGGREVRIGSAQPVAGADRKRAEAEAMNAPTPARARRSA